MELDRINLIINSTVDELKDINYLENLIVKLGFNTEILQEQPAVVRENGGGLLIWQYPNQFSKYLILLSTLSIKSYIEIGCRWGGTFVLTSEYLKRFNELNKSVAVDIIDSPVITYCLENDTDSNRLQFLKLNSQSPEFKKYMTARQFDLIFIDGDHSYEGVKNDYEVCRNSGKFFVFHDIVNAACPGVVQFWNELKQNEAADFDFYEFTDQYDEVYNSTGNRYLGIGVAVRRAT